MDDDDNQAPVANPLTWCDPFIIGFALAEDIAQSFANLFGNCKTALGMHANLICERKQFEREAGLDIERITQD
jgi:hypothetical protein